MNKELREWIKEGIVIAIVLCLFLISFRVVLPALGYNFCEVEGSSMEPTLRSGDLVLIAKTQEYEVGDIIVFKSSLGDKFIVHRIIKIEGNKIVTKGDNNQIPDWPIQTSDVIGEVVMIVPQFETIRRIVIFVALLLLIPTEILPFLRKILPKLRHRESQNEILVLSYFFLTRKLGRGMIELGEEKLKFFDNWLLGVIFVISTVITIFILFYIRINWWDLPSVQLEKIQMPLKVLSIICIITNLIALISGIKLSRLLELEEKKKKDRKLLRILFIILVFILLGSIFIPVVKGN